MPDHSGVISVLHVDDEPDFAEMAAEFIERQSEGIQVETANGVEEALEIFEHGRFDCIVSDYEMPSQNGIEFLKTIRAKDADLPFILFTGKGSEEVAGEAISAGVTDYLQKKSGTSQYSILVNRIENVVERDKARKQAAQAERKLSQIADNANDILWMFTADWEELLFINSAYESVWGRSIDELRNYPQSFQRGVHPDDRSLILAAMDQLSDGEAIDTEFRVNAEEDFSRWVWVKGYPILDEAGEVYRVAGFARDITERKTREQQRIRQQERFEFALNATDSYMFEIDFSSGRERRFGDWDALHNVEQSEVPSTEAFIERAVHPDDQSKVRGAHESFEPEPGATVTFDYRTPPDDGGSKWIRAEIGIRTDEDAGGLIGIGLATDVSDLQRERHRLEALFENSIDAIVRCEFVNGDPIIRAANSAFEETFGCPEGSAIGESLDDLVVPEDPSKREAADSLNRRIEAGEPIQAEVRRQTPEGVRDFLVQSTPLNEGEGSFAIYSDITDQKRRERELERYESIIQALGDPVYALDQEARYTFVNDAFVEATGYDRSEIIGSHVSKIVPEEYIEKGQQVIESLLESGTPQTATWQLERRTAGGRLVPTENHMTVLTMDGSFRGTAGVLREVSEREEGELQLRETQSWYEKILQHISDYVIVIDESAEIRYVSPAVEQMLGYEPDEVVGTSALEYVHPDDSELAAEAFGQTISEPSKEVTEEFRTRTSDDSYRWVEARGRSYLDDEDIGGLLVSVRDISGRKERQQELNRRNQQLEEFASVVSHDLRNPLDVIDGRVELARDEYDSEHLDAIARATDRMYELIEDLLTLAREGEKVGEIEPVDLKSVAARCWENVETEKATLNVETNASLSADRSLLRQLLENLLRNAIEHGGSEITVTIGTLDDGSGIFVEDNGPGIPVVDPERVFEAGYTTADNGIGFGLTIVKEIAAGHGWEVDLVESTSGGARFEITGIDFVD